MRLLQAALVKLGYLTQAQMNTGPGTFGKQTEAALVAFQKASGLEGVGVYGVKTRQAMARALAAPPPAPAPQPPLKGLFHADAFDRRVALTFDDGPHPVNTPKVLDILKQYNARATFFVTGENAKRYPELIKRIVAEGHTLGNHSHRHADLTRLTAAEVKADLETTHREVEKALGRPYALTQVRPPYGAMDQEVKDVLRANETLAVMWNVDSNDWRHRNDDGAILKEIFEGANSVYAGGGVVLFHDIHPQTVRVLDDVLARLQREQFKIVKTDKFLSEKYPAVHS